MMKCMILAAGRGERLRPLTDKIPKPLVRVAGKPLIEHHLDRLKSAGYEEIVINLSHLGELIQEQLGDGRRLGVQIIYSPEGYAPLETAGGIIRALPLLGEKPFLVINGDIWCDHPLSFAGLPEGKLAHLVLVDNPPHNPAGDFFYEKGEIFTQGDHPLTFSGIGVYHPALFKDRPVEKLSLAPILRTAVNDDLVSAEHFTGKWFDIGTVERREQAEHCIQR